MNEANASRLETSRQFKKEIQRKRFEHAGGIYKGIPNRKSIPQCLDLYWALQTLSNQIFSSPDLRLNLHK